MVTARLKARPESESAGGEFVTGAGVSVPTASRIEAGFNQKEQSSSCSPGPLAFGLR